MAGTDRVAGTEAEIADAADVLAAVVEVVDADAAGDRVVVGAVDGKVVVAGDATKSFATDILGFTRINQYTV